MDYGLMLTLAVAIFAVYIQYTNQRERRHGEIVQLRSGLLATLTLSRYRITSVRLNIEALWLEISKMPKYESRYYLAEKLPALLDKIKEDVEFFDGLFLETEKIDSQKMNNSHTLLRLQKLKAEIERVESAALDAENKIIGFWAKIRLEQSDMETAEKV